MLIRDLKRFFVLVVPLFTAIFLTIRLIKKHTHPSYYQDRPEWLRQPAVAAPVSGGKQQHKHDPQREEKRPPATQKQIPNLQSDQQDPSKLSSTGAGTGTGTDGEDPFEGGSEAVPPTHLEVSSAGLGGSSKRYFTIQFADRPTINPNILPHPTLSDTFVIVAQEHPAPPGSEMGHVSELVCNAAFRRGVLSCVSFPIALAIAPTGNSTTGTVDRCNDPRDKRYAALSLNVGPHDARVFYGPRGVPFVVYGSNSGYTCFGQWIQDFRVPARWDTDPLGIAGPKPTTSTAATATSTSLSEAFYNGTEMHRPHDPSAATTTARPAIVEKNWFVFWDRQGAMYTHHDMHPKRSFAMLGPAGAAIGPDLAPTSADADARCMSAYMPRTLAASSSAAGAGAVPRPGPNTADEPESLHQSTNSLAVTLCARSDPTCEALPGNTFILVIVHHKTFRSFHSAYEPYAVLFRQSAPFGLYAVSTRPIWIKGRRTLIPSASSSAPKKPAFEDFSLDKPKEEEEEDAAKKEPRQEMFYVTSISWARADKRYHGFLDDTLFLSFGIEDKRSAGIDVVAGDLLKGLGLCEELPVAAAS